MVLTLEASIPSAPQRFAPKFSLTRTLDEVKGLKTTYGENLTTDNKEK